ncbi:MAG TPA: CRISPR-associated helicase Cas3', partial [Nitrososphaera sp.]|nr:CRISPR-associated helicase Cas3' [Nitrososphaera sp.]
AVEVSKALRTGNAHFEFPRGQIYSSIVIFDESHLFALDNNGTHKQMFTIFLSTLTQLACAGVPIFVITATLPTKIRDYIQKQLSDSRIITSAYRQGDDPLFENKEGRRKISTSVLSTDEDAMKIIKTVRNQKPRILVIVNEVPRAIHFYKKLKDYDPVLLHGRITESERKVNMDRLDATNSWLVIGTQVIEAGIDVDANVLVTDLAPMDRLVQRIGRVARTGNGSEGEVYVIPNYSTVYPASDLKKTLYMLERLGNDIDWVFGAQNLVDNAYATLSVPDMIDRNLLRFLERIDENLLYGSGDMRDLLTALGSFPREAVLIKAYADVFFDNKTLTDPDGYIGLESSKAYQALCNSKKVVENNRIVELGPEMLRDITPHNLHRTLEQYGYNGILLDHYERGVGYL